MNFNFSGKKILLIGFAVVMLVGIPLTVFLLQQQQEVRSRAEKSTNISFTPDSSQTAPIQKAVGDSIPLDIMVNPGKNLVSFVKLEIQYDPEKLATTAAGFQANTVAFPSVLEGPVYTPGKIAVTLSVGPDPTKSIQTTTKAATITFKALAGTPQGTPTLVTYGATTQVLSLGSNDQASENVLSSATPATIIIGGGAVSETPAPTTAEEPTSTPEASATPTTEPTVTTAPTEAPTTAPGEPTATPAPTSGDGGDTTSNESPVCSSLVVDRETSGNAPFSLTFTANGTDTDGTVSKVSFNFGDGQVSDVTDAGGIGTNSVNAQVSHTYNNPGTFQAYATLTDSSNSVSQQGNCQQTITVTASGSATTAPVQNNPTIAPTGTTEVLIGVGVAALSLILGGAFLFFFL